MHFRENFLNATQIALPFSGTTVCEDAPDMEAHKMAEVTLTPSGSWQAVAILCLTKVPCADICTAERLLFYQMRYF